jgi:hypothetical protein
MSKPNGSLILKERAELEAAPFLFSEDDLPKIDRQKPKWNCTGEYLKKHRPDIYNAAVTMLLEPGLSLRMICRTLHVSHNTLASIQERENLDTATRKKDILKTITRGLRVCAERVEELAPEMGARDAIIATGVLTEKMELLSGAPTLRVQIGQQISIPEQLANLLNEAMEKMKQVKAQQIDLGGENTEQKALMNGDDKQSCDADNGAGTAVIDVGATLVSDEPGNEAGKAI